MESRDFIDSIKAEKENALGRYKRFTNITKLIQVMEVFVAVAVISWSSSHIPSVFKFSGQYVITFSSYFMNQHVVFLVGNVIVVVCYVLSRYADSGNDAGASGFHYDDCKYNRFTHPKTNLETTPPQVIGITESQIPMIRFRNEKSIVKSESEVGAVTAIKQAAKQMERFQRTNSDKSRIPVKSGRELRRSVTEMRRSTAVNCGGEGRTIQAVEELSNEEFRIAVERFILKQQRLLKQQSMVEVEDGC